MEFILTYLTAVLIFTMVGRVIYLNRNGYFELAVAAGLLVFPVILLWILGISFVYSVMLTVTPVWILMEIFAKRG